MKRPTTLLRTVAVLGAVLLIASSAAGAAETWTTAPAGATYETDSGLEVTPTVDHGVPQDPYDGSDTLVLSDASFTASGPASLNISQFNGTRTEISAIDASSNAITIDPDDKSEVTVSGGVTELSFEDATLDGTAQITYSASTSGTITVTGLPASTEFAAVTTGGDVLTTGTTSASGTADISAPSGSSVEVALVDPSAPTVDNSTLSPADGAKLTQREANLSVDASDADFATDGGDTLTAEFVVDGSVVATDTLSSNGTASVTVSGLEGGEHDWYVRVSDHYNTTTTSETQTFSVPSTLEIYNESTNPGLLENASTTVRFYYENGTELGYTDRPATNGTVNLTGLPTGQPFVVVANADGYYQRRIFVRSLYDQQRIYLLNESKQGVETVFEISDYSGAYPSETTVLEVQRAINGSWKTVEGDYFGATGEFGTVLQYNVRYRLVLYKTNTGESRRIGIYQPTNPQQTTIQVSPSGEIEEPTRPPTATIKPQTRRIPAVNDSAIRVALRANSESVSEWRVTATVDETDTTLWTVTTSESELQQELDASGLAGKHVTVRVEATVDGSVVEVGSATYTISSTPTNNNSLLALLSRTEGLAAPGTTNAFTTFIAMLVTVFGVAGVSTQLPVGGETAGLVGVLILTGFSAIGWVGYEIVFAAAVPVVSIALLRRGL
jgi:hypothetical protein